MIKYENCTCGDIEQQVVCGHLSDDFPSIQLFFPKVKNI